MERSLQTGICYKIIVSKDKTINFTYDEIVEGVQKSLDLSLYKLANLENCYEWTLKDRVLSCGLKGFLQEQYKLLSLERESIVKLMLTLWDLKNSQDIVVLCKENKLENLTYSTVYSNINCGRWGSILAVEIDIISFLYIPKIDTSNNEGLLYYLESLIKRNNPYKIAQAVRAFIV